MADLVTICPPACQFHSDKVGEEAADQLRSFREQGYGAMVYHRHASKLLDRPLNMSSVQRHLKHYRAKEKDPLLVLDPTKKLADLQILELVIQRGAAVSHTWKPGIKDVMEAMKLKMQMTGNSAFDDLISLFDGANLDDDEDDEVVEAPEAVGLPDEQGEDLAEPLI